MSTTLPMREQDSETESPKRTLSICLINPRFDPSYWGFEYALPLYPGDKRSTMISGSLSSVAGLCGDHQVRLLDENVEEIDWESLRNYDIVGVTGMNVQKERIHQILARLRELKVFTVVGGPFVSVKEEFFDGLCDAKFIGEAETTWPQFLDDYARGKPTEYRYEQSQPTDMTKVPRPRYDHLKVDRYATGRCSTRADARSSANSATSSSSLGASRESKTRPSSWPNWTTCAELGSIPSSSSTTTSSGTRRRPRHCCSY